MFCPSCGNSLKHPKNNQFFKEADKEFEQAEKMFEIPKFMMKPLLKKGINITITSDNISPPRIEVTSSGGHKHMQNHKHESRPARVAKSTAEPETTVQEFEDRKVVTLNLPDVKDLSDIEITQLNQSIEVKAFAGDKAYFKLIPIPSNATVNNEFKDGVLKIEVVK